MKMQQWMMCVPLAVLMCAGCQTTARIQASRFQKKADTPTEKLTILSKATDARKSSSDQVGRHTISVFMIPGPGVVSGGGHVEEAVGDLAIKALQEVGYNLNVVNNISDSETPTLVFQIDMIRNYSFTWLYPIGLTFGRAQLSPILFKNDGTVLWRGKASGGGFCPSLIYISGFETALQTEMTSVMRQIIQQMKSDSFCTALATK